MDGLTFSFAYLLHSSGWEEVKAGVGVLHVTFRQIDGDGNSKEIVVDFNPAFLKIYKRARGNCLYS